ncbi:unnamed protein product [Gulo gulo]|uniref:Uncharacterized protein n=1 Tax=Gulo gulo TaxID=48420 RepID=A0A9X9Q4X8_GULGU|nr:unnamed protein product [Gulo gulo]
MPGSHCLGSKFFSFN